MFRRVRNFVERHPKKITTVVVVAAGALAWKYAKRRIQQWQEQESQKLMDSARRQAHFESTLRTADAAIEAMGPALATVVCESLDTADVIAKLRELRDSKGEKWIERWGEMKILVVSRVVSLVYCETILCLLLRVQLAVLAGQMYQQSRDLGASDPQSPPQSFDESHLAACQHFISTGVPRVCHLVHEAVSRCPLITNMSLSHRLSLESLEKLLWSVQTLLCEDPSTDPLHNIPRYAIPEGVSSQAGTNAAMVRLQAETSDLLQTDEVWSLVSSCVSRGLAFTVDTVANFYAEPRAEQSTSSALPAPLSLPLAKVIPILDGVVKRAKDKTLQEPTSNIDFLRLLISDEKLKTLAANVYEAFGEPDKNQNSRQLSFF